jgi:hypothetical protein
VGRGQITKAFGRDQYLWRGGKDFLQSFMRFLELENCGNFKGLGLQFF